MASLLLSYYVGVCGWIINQLEDVVEYPEDYMLPTEMRELQKLYWSGKDKQEIVKEFIQKHPKVHPELAYLAIEKLDAQNGGLSYIDRFLATLG